MKPSVHSTTSAPAALKQEGQMAAGRAPMRPVTIAVATVVMMHVLLLVGWRHLAERPPLVVAPRSEPLALFRVALHESQARPSEAQQPKPPPSAAVAEESGPATEQPLPFVSSATLDREIVPRSEPDLQRLQGLHFSGLPLRVRLFIDARGVVTAVHVLASQESEETVSAVTAMFLSTAFVPGERAGRAVPAFTDVELQLDSHPN